jgi:hypothetical protein
MGIRENVHCSGRRDSGDGLGIRFSSNGTVRYDIIGRISPRAGGGRRFRFYVYMKPPRRSSTDS